ncbi:MAG: HAD-IIIC family phosphatase [Phycisphaerae bacterium]|nr:HAD-IIIC family phosphatase [Phycisphaerae bacterium]MCZ2398301.1 HAD-IIIC family phosphatase [Phycisphaerae bacterium]
MIRGAAPDAALAAHNRAARAIGALIEAGSVPDAVSPLRVALLRSVTAEPLTPSLVCALAERGFAARVTLGQLGNIAAETLSAESFVYREPHDVGIVLALAEHVLPGLNGAGGAAIESEGEAFVAQVAQLAERFSGLVLVCNLVPPAARVAPQLAAQTADSARYAIPRVNRRLAELTARYPNVQVCDLEALAAEIGAERFWSKRDLAASLQPFAAAALPPVAGLLADTCLLYKRSPVKVIVLDCDNTLWGGIVGEDGLAGIRLGETYPGWCFQQFQRQLDQLSRLGFLLALNSKNNEADVRAVFEQHRGMVLKLDQIAAMRVNWSDKVSNLRELAEELNLGLDSFVFIDDNDFELNFVREQLPQVTCLKVPEQPWLLPDLLPGARGVDRLRVTAEDRKKSEMYAQERRREHFRTQAGDLQAYLRGLEIHLTFEPFDEAQHLARAAQLTQKTNQFNLTTRRYSEAELKNAVAGGARVYLASLRDRFGEYGRIALAIVRPDENQAPALAPGARIGTPATGPRGACTLDVFLMSCRVIGRGVEDSFLRLVMRRAREAGFDSMRAEFIPTARNVVCKDFLANFGFREAGREPAGAVSYEYDLRSEIAAAAPWLTVHGG